VLLLAVFRPALQLSTCKLQEKLDAATTAMPSLFSKGKSKAQQTVESYSGHTSPNPSGKKVCRI
jgi:hypothetical protein